MWVWVFLGWQDKYIKSETLWRVPELGLRVRLLDSGIGQSPGESGIHSNQGGSSLGVETHVL